jgi:8-oxo-dGTP pyrophosphatase MutT (NUDIX family)
MSTQPAVALQAAGAPAVEAYFAALTPAEDRVYLSRNGMPELQVTSYLTDAAPPTLHVRSVRSVVLKGDSVLALQREDRAHVLPGGRREPGETLSETLERELLEETGWLTTVPRQIGVVRLRWLTARPGDWPEDSPYYPDFLWLIHMAEVATHRPEAFLQDADEGAPIFIALGDLERLGLLERSPWAPENRVFLAEALRQR